MSELLDRDRIADLVDRFYDRVQADPLLGPVFADVVDDWPTHKATLTSFWCSVALREGSYKGNPMALHKRLPIAAEHFRRWLALWQQTTRDCLPAAAADEMRAHAERIGRSLQLGLGIDAQARPLGLPVIGGGASGQGNGAR